MRIGILAPYSRPWDINGAEGSGMNIFIRESAEALSEAGINIDVYTRRSRDYDTDYNRINNNLEHHLVSAGPECKLGRLESLKECNNNDFNLRQDKNTDFVIANHYISSDWIHKILRHGYQGKIGYFSHSIGKNPNRDIFYPEQIQAEDSICPYITWMANCNQELEIVTKLYTPKSIKKVEPGTLTFNQKKDKDSDTIYFIGRQTSSKGFDWYQELANKFKDESFIAIGPKNNNKDTHNLKYLSYMPMQDLVTELKNAKLIIHPSRYEHFGLVPLMALQMQIPVLATRQGSAFDLIIEEKNGFLADNSYQSLETKLNKFLNARLKWYTNPVLEEYTWNKFVDKIIKIGKEQC